MPSGAKPGERRGGRAKGTKNKITLEREQRALEALRGKAARLAPQVWAKDELEDLIPEAKQLLGAIKGVVAQLQARVIDQFQGNPGPVTDYRALDKLREWASLLKEAQAAASLIMTRAGEYQSPRLQRIAVGGAIGLIGLGGQQEQPATEDNVVTIDDPNAASRVYQRFIQQVA